MSSKKTLNAIRQALNVINAMEPPITLRQLFYGHVIRNLFENSSKNYSRLSRNCVIGREEGLIPEEVFTDRMRPFHRRNQWRSVPEFLHSIQQSYRRNIWEDQPNYVELFLEKDALLGVIQPIADKYHIGIQGGRGYVSYTVLQKSAERFKIANDKGKRCYLLYAGDFDPSGLDIFEALVHKLKNRHSIDFVHAKRIALNHDQVQKYQLPSAPPKEKDSRTKKFIEEYGNIAVELDALPPNVLRGIVEDEIAKLLDIDLFKKSQGMQLKDRETLLEMIQSLKKRPL